MSTKELSKIVYKNFQGSIEWCSEDNCFYGKILHIEDLITYEGFYETDLINNFKLAVERYLRLLEKKE